MQYIREEIKEKILDIKNLIDIEELDSNEGFIYISLLMSRNSLDPNTKTGAVIVNNYLEILSCGFNKVPEGYLKHVNWHNNNYSEDWLNSKGPYVIHAERAAIYNGLKKGKNLNDGMMFATLFPCNECALTIYESGINRFYYYDDKYHDKEFSIAARNIFDNCDIHYEQVEITDNYLKKNIKKIGEL